MTETFADDGPIVLRLATVERALHMLTYVLSTQISGTQDMPQDYLDELDRIAFDESQLNVNGPRDTLLDRRLDRESFKIMSRRFEELKRRLADLENIVYEDKGGFVGQINHRVSNAIERHEREYHADPGDPGASDLAQRVVGLLDDGLSDHVTAYVEERMADIADDDAIDEDARDDDYRLAINRRVIFVPDDVDPVSDESIQWRRSLMSEAAMRGLGKFCEETFHGVTGYSNKDDMWKAFAAIVYDAALQHALIDLAEKAKRTEGESLESQVDRLATVLLEEFGGPTESEGAIDTAIRKLRESKVEFDPDKTWTRLYDEDKIAPAYDEHDRQFNLGLRRGLRLMADAVKGAQ